MKGLVGLKIKWSNAKHKVRNYRARNTRLNIALSQKWKVRIRYKLWPWVDSTVLHLSELTFHHNLIESFSWGKLLVSWFDSRPQTNVLPHLWILSKYKSDNGVSLPNCEMLRREQRMIRNLTKSVKKVDREMEQMQIQWSQFICI